MILVSEKILDGRQKATRKWITTKFLVQWKNLDESHSTWQTDEELQNYPDLLKNF